MRMESWRRTGDLMGYKVQEVEAEVSPRGGGERRAGICYHSSGREPRA